MLLAIFLFWSDHSGRRALICRNLEAWPVDTPTSAFPNLLCFPLLVCLKMTRWNWKPWLIFHKMLDSLLWAVFPYVQLWFFNLSLFFSLLFVFHSVAHSLFFPLFISSESPSVVTAFHPLQGRIYRTNTILIPSVEYFNTLPGMFSSSICT
jgi:hypothetical protein